MPSNTNNPSQIYFPVAGDGRISSRYDYRVDPVTGKGKLFHNGIDYAIPVGTPIIAVKDGFIPDGGAGWQNPDRNVGFGLRITIDYYDDDFSGRYGHLSQIAKNPETGELFKAGDFVYAGQIIGYSGNTGHSTGPHLHYEESKIDNGIKTSRNPTQYLVNAIRLNRDGSINHNAINTELYGTVLNFSGSSSNPFSLFQQTLKAELNQDPSTLDENSLAGIISKSTKLTLKTSQELSYSVGENETFGQVVDRLISEGKITSSQELIDANPDIEDINLISVGDKINIPVLKTSDSYSIFDDSSIKHYADSGMIATDGYYYVDAEGDSDRNQIRELKYYDKNGNQLSDNDLTGLVLKTKDGNGNYLTLAKDGDIFTRLKDGTFAAFKTVIDSIDNSLTATADFLNSQAKTTIKIITDRLKSDTYLNSLIGSVLADIILGENDPEQIAKHLAEGQLKSLATSLLDENIRKILIDNGMTQSAIDNLVGPQAVNYVVSIDAESGAKIVTALDATGNPIGPTIQGTIYTAILNFAISAADSSGWNSEEYAQAAKVAIASAIVSAVVTTVLTAIAPGIGTVAGIVISAVVNALVVGPLVTYADDQYAILEDAFRIARDLTKDLIKDPVNTIEDFDPIETFKQFNELAIDYVENIGKFGRNILIGGYNLFGGNYGKTLKPGEYFDPYSFIQVEPKLDEHGNPTGDYNIIGLEREGTVLIASENGNDDIFGTGGQDIMIGKSGKNTIIGYGGNDHIEGRSNDDVLIGGQGDDKILGGLGNDYFEGGVDSNLVFGGIGRTVSSVFDNTYPQLFDQNKNPLYLDVNQDFLSKYNSQIQIISEIRV